MAASSEEEEPSYLDYETFLDPSFSATSFANTLVITTNNPNDTPIDLTTPLSRVLFDVQEVDTHIDNLTSRSAIPLLLYTKEHVEASSRILQELEAQVATLSSSYERLQREVTAKHEAADKARLVTERLWQTLKLGRAVGRCLTLGRQLEGQMGEFSDGGPGSGRKEDVRAMVRCANTVLSLHQIFSATRDGGEGEGLQRIIVIRSLRAELVDVSEKTLLSRAEQIVAQFSMSTLMTGESDGSSDALTTTYAQTEDMRSRVTSALITLYLLSPVSDATTKGSFEPSLMISTLQEYLRRSITSSLAGMSAGLTTLSKLERNLLEVSARCQNIVALEILLESIKSPQHPLLSDPEVTGERKKSDNKSSNLLQPLLSSLDTSSLASYFWRSMSSQLSSRVQKIMREGGVSSRTLRSNKERVRDAIRECVNRGSQLPPSSLTRARGTTVGNWEREAAVMVGSVINVIGR